MASRLWTTRKVAALLVALLGLAAACTASSDSADTVRVLKHADFDLPEQAIQLFEQDTGLTVVVLNEPDRSAVVNLLTRWGSNPVADVVIGIDTFDRKRVIEEALVEPYQPLNPSVVNPELRVENDWLIPVSYTDACLNYAPSSFAQPEDTVLTQLPTEDDSEPAPLPPTGFDDLLSTAHAGLAVLPDAATSRQGLYFLAALERRFPQNRQTDQDSPENRAWPQVLSLLLNAGAEIEPTWEEAYFDRFLQGTVSLWSRGVGSNQGTNNNQASASSGETSGFRPLTWGSSGMTAVYAQYHPNLSHQPIQELTVDIAVVPDDCVRVVNYAAVITGTSNRRNAGLFMDFVSSPEFQFEIPDRFGSRPARQDIVRTELWREFGVEVDAAVLDADYVGDNWELWRLTWSQVVREVGEAAEPTPPVVTVTLPDN